jgi:hypothetical protein
LVIWSIGNSPEFRKNAQEFFGVDLKRIVVAVTSCFVTGLIGSCSCITAVVVVVVDIEVGSYSCCSYCKSSGSTTDSGS